MSWRKPSDIEAWNLSMRLAAEFAAILDRLPASGDRKFCEDARDAAGSVPRNIAEGFGRFTNKDFGHFVEYAYASLLETHTNLLIAHNRRFTTAEQHDSLIALYEQTKAMTVGLLKMLKRRAAQEEDQASRARRR